MDETAWIIVTASLVLLALNILVIRRTPEGRTGMRGFGRELTTLRSVRTWMLAVGGLLSLVMTLILATVGNDGSPGMWVLLAGFLLVDLVFLRALLQRWRDRVQA